VRPVGYLVNRPSGLEGEPGLAYDYILAGNGLFVRAVKLARTGKTLLRATVLVADAEVRGLAPLARHLELPQGKVPGDIWQAALRMVGLAHPSELYVAVRWDGGYRLEVPEQETTPASISYTAVPDTVVDIHSHGSMEGFFSGTDNADDQGFRISAVVGHVDRLFKDAAARVSVYGHTGPVWLGDIFVL
jgi:PRTRC genetic system protein A